MKIKTEIRLRPIDVDELTNAAGNCGLSLRSFLAEIVECKASELRQARAEEKALAQNN